MGFREHRRGTKTVYIQEFIKLFVGVLGSESSMYQPFLNDSWKELYHLQLGSEPVSERTWSEVIHQSEKGDITIRITPVQHGPLREPFVVPQPAISQSQQPTSLNNHTELAAIDEDQELQASDLGWQQLADASTLHPTQQPMTAAVSSAIPSLMHGFHDLGASIMETYGTRSGATILKYKRSSSEGPLSLSRSDPALRSRLYAENHARYWQRDSFASSGK